MPVRAPQGAGPAHGGTDAARSRSQAAATSFTPVPGPSDQLTVAEIALQPAAAAPSSPEEPDPSAQSPCAGGTHALDQATASDAEATNYRSGARDLSLADDEWLRPRREARDAQDLSGCETGAGADVRGRSLGEGQSGGEREPEEWHDSLEEADSADVGEEALPADGLATEDSSRCQNGVSEHCRHSIVEVQNLNFSGEGQPPDTVKERLVEGMGTVTNRLVSGDITKPVDADSGPAAPLRWVLSDEGTGAEGTEAGPGAPLRRVRSREVSAVGGTETGVPTLLQRVLSHEVRLANVEAACDGVLPRGLEGRVRGGILLPRWSASAPPASLF